MGGPVVVVVVGRLCAGRTEEADWPVARDARVGNFTVLREVCCMAAVARVVVGLVAVVVGRTVVVLFVVVVGRAVVVVGFLVVVGLTVVLVVVGLAVGVSLWVVVRRFRRVVVRWFRRVVGRWVGVRRLVVGLCVGVRRVVILGRTINTCDVTPTTD